MAHMTEKRKAAGDAVVRELTRSLFKDITSTEFSGAYTIDFKPATDNPWLNDQLPSSVHISRDGSFGEAVIRMPIRDDNNEAAMKQAAEKAASAAGPEWYAGMQHSGQRSNGAPHVVLPLNATERSPRQLVREMNRAVRAYIDAAGGPGDFSF